MYEFGRQRRIRSGARFSAVFKKSYRCFRTRYFVLHILPSSYPESRLGVIVSKRVAGRAVDRNRLKRHVREVFRVTTMQASWDCVIVLRHKSLGAEVGLRQGLIQVFQRVAGLRPRVY